MLFFFFSSRRRHTRLQGDWSSDVCSSDLTLAENQIDLYVGDAASARARLAANWAALRRSMLLRIQMFRIEAHHLRARCALAFARHAPSPEPYLREAERDAQRVAREQMLWSNPLADLLM